MSSIKFNHVFAGLLVLSGLSAFVIPPQYTTRAMPQLQSVFALVSVPARHVGQWAHDRVARRESRDQRDVEEVKEENALLRRQLVIAEAQLDLEQKRNAQWSRLGSLKDRCVPVEGAGADAGPRDSLALRGSTLQHVRDNAVALYPGGVAGQIQGRAGVAGAQLRLITDRGFRVRGYFIRIGRDLKPVRLTPTVLFSGVGGALVVSPPLSEPDVRQYTLAPGDVAVADDRDWPNDLVGHQLGTVVRIQPNGDSSNFSEIRIEPTTNLEMLSEVMVLVK